MSKRYCIVDEAERWRGKAEVYNFEREEFWFWDRPWEKSTYQMKTFAENGYWLQFSTPNKVKAKVIMKQLIHENPLREISIKEFSANIPRKYLNGPCN